MKPKTYQEVVSELWESAQGNAMIAGLSLSKMPIDEEPITIHCLLTMQLIREVERLKALLNDREPTSYHTKRPANPAGATQALQPNKSPTGS